MRKVDKILNYIHCRVASEESIEFPKVEFPVWTKALICVCQTLLHSSLCLGIGW